MEAPLEQPVDGPVVEVNARTEASFPEVQPRLYLRSGRSPRTSLCPKASRDPWTIPHSDFMQSEDRCRSLLETGLTTGKPAVVADYSQESNHSRLDACSVAAGSCRATQVQHSTGPRRTLRHLAEHGSISGHPMSKVRRGPTEIGSFWTSTQAPCSQLHSEESYRDAHFGWILPSPRVSTPASFRLRRFSRP
jgi:hypothetical protein